LNKKITNRKPIFSIITVCYNSEDTIIDTFESILNQTFQDFEYLIVDGGSTDKTIAIIREYEKKFNGKLTWISESDSGIYEAMNKGIKKSIGNIIGIINSDDWYELDTLCKIEKISKNESNQEDFIIKGEMNKIFDNGKIIIKSKSINDTNLFNKVKLTVTHPAVFSSIASYNKNGLFDLDFKIVADYDYLLRSYLNKTQFIFSDKIFANMRMEGVSSFSRKGYQDAIEERLVMKKNGIGLYRRNWIFVLKYINLSLRKFKRKIIPSKFKN